MWQQRIYAFVLRRLLGPYLTTRSRCRLHESINISLREGRFELFDIDLDGPGLASKLNLNVEVKCARVSKLCVTLSLVYDSEVEAEEEGEETESCDNAGLGFGLGLGVRLLATIELDGVNIEAAPVSSSYRGKSDITTVESSDSSGSNVAENTGTKGTGQSYLQALLNSLKLSLSVTNLDIRISSSDFESKQVWMTLHVTSLSYHDSPSSMEVKVDSNHGRIVVGKDISFNRIIVKAGGNSPSPLQQDEEVLKVDGQARIKLHVLSFPSMANASEEKIKIQRFYEIVLGQEIICNINFHIFECLERIATELVAASGRGATGCDQKETSVAVVGNEGETKVVKASIRNSIEGNESKMDNSDTDIDCDEEDMGLLSRILRQQLDAHRLASRQEVRGGLLVPDLSNLKSNADADFDNKIDNFSTLVTFDAFFDANDEGYSHYQGLLDSNSESSTGCHDDLNSSELTLYVKEISVTLHIDKLNPTTNDHLSSNKIGNVGVCLSLRLGDCNVTVRQSKNASDFSIRVGFFEIEDGVASFSDSDNQNIMLQKESIFYFVEENPTEECISIAGNTKAVGKNRKVMEVSIKMEPLQFVLKKRIALSVTQIKDLISSSKSNITSQFHSKEEKKDNMNSIETSLQIKLSCEHITASLPLESGIVIPEHSAGSTTSHVEFKHLFKRSGYFVEYLDGLDEPVLSMVVSDFSANLSRTMLQDTITCKLDHDHFYSGFTCQKFLVSISAPLHYRKAITSPVSEPVVAYRLDFLSLESETQIDPDAIIKLEFTYNPIDGKSEAFKKKRAKRFFPVVTQLSFVKASQQHESEDIDKMYLSYDNRGRSHSEASSNTKKEIVRGSDPQATMLKEASICESYLSVYIPSIVMDLSPCETMFLEKFINGLEDKEKKQNCEENTNSTPSIGLSFRYDQLSIALHEDDEDEHAKQATEVTNKAVYSQLLICDGISTHILFGASGLKNMRFLCDSITFYEVNESGLVHSESERYSSDMSIKSSISCRCNLLRRRRFKNSLANKTGSAIFFRSKLSYPLSPKTPSLLIDMIVNRDDEDIERSLYLSMYDMTYRYEVESQWLDRLTALLPGTRADIGDASLENRIQGKDTVSASVTKLFITVSDCNFDYTSPLTFSRASRTIMRIGEVRISSNVIIPSADIQAFKVSVVDVALYLSNKRSRHNIENSRLCLSNLIFNPSELCTNYSMGFVDNIPQSFEDALFKLKFVSVASLDFFDAAVATISNEAEHTEEQYSKKNTPDLTVSLSIGRLCLFTCKDSFACLSETIGDLTLKLTMPTRQEIEEMKRVNTTIRSDDVVTDSPSCVESVMCGERANGKQRQNLNYKEETVGSLFDESLTEVMERELFSQIETSADNSEIIDVATKPRDAKNCSSNDNVEKVLEGETVVIDDFYAIDKSHPHSDSFLTDVNSITDDKLRSSVIGGQGWMSVDYQWSCDTTIPEGEEQCGGWYAIDEPFDNRLNNNAVVKPQLSLPENATVVVEGKNYGNRVPRVFPCHVSINPVSDPLAGGDMEASKFAGTKSPPVVKLRFLVNEMSLCCRFFDGYDWKSRQRPLYTRPLPQQGETCNGSEDDSKARLMVELLGNMPDEGQDKMFEESEMKNAASKAANGSYTPRKRRQPKVGFQFCFSGLKLRLDTFAESEKHCLASCMDLSLLDMFISETVSSELPVKIIGEWINDHEHPRDSSDGLLMMKMVSVLPDKKVSADGKLMSNEGRVTLELLPVRCYIHQSALRFIRGFFRKEDDFPNESNRSQPEDAPPEIFFQNFFVKPFKLKVNYTPYKIDTSSLKEGNYIEILNLLPLEEMVLNLKAVELRNLTGWVSVMSELVCKWVQDVISTQMHKFLTTTSPIHPIANVGGGVKNFVMIPLEEYKQRGHVGKAFQRGTATLAEVVAYETLNISSKLTSFAARTLGATTVSPGTSELHSLGDASSHAMASLSRGLKEANAKIIMMPYREYHKTGTKGLMKSVIKGIPVAICAPLSGAAEALSYGLLGVRNQLRPDLREEEEASKQFQPDY